MKNLCQSKKNKPQQNRPDAGQRGFQWRAPWVCQSLSRCVPSAPHNTSQTALIKWVKKKQTDCASTLLILSYIMFLTNALGWQTPLYLTQIMTLCFTDGFSLRSSHSKRKPQTSRALQSEPSVRFLVYSVKQQELNNVGLLQTLTAWKFMTSLCISQTRNPTAAPTKHTSNNLNRFRRQMNSIIVVTYMSGPQIWLARRHDV